MVSGDHSHSSVSMTEKQQNVHTCTIHGIVPMLGWLIVVATELHVHIIYGFWFTLLTVCTVDSEPDQ